MQYEKPQLGWQGVSKSTAHATNAVPSAKDMDLSASIGGHSLGGTIGGMGGFGGNGGSLGGTLGRSHAGFNVKRVGEPRPVQRDSEPHNEHITHETSEVVTLEPKILDIPTERVIEKVVEVSEVQVVEKVVEDVIEIPVYRYEEEIIEKQIEQIVEVEKIVEVPQIHRRIIHRELKLLQYFACTPSAC